MSVLLIQIKQYAIINVLYCIFKPLPVSWPGQDATHQHVLDPVWSEGPILPDKLIDLVTKDFDGHEDSDSDHKESNGFDSEDSDTDCSSDDYDSE